MNSIVVKPINFWLKELEEIAVMLVIGIVVIFSLSIFTKLTVGDTWFAFVFMFIVKIGELLTEYRTRQIDVDPIQKTISLRLYSLMSGDKRYTFDLSSIEVKIKGARGLTWILQGREALIIKVNNYTSFRLTGKYGFTSADLRKCKQMVEDAKG